MQATKHCCMHTLLFAGFNTSIPGRLPEYKGDAESISGTHYSVRDVHAEALMAPCRKQDRRNADTQAQRTSFQCALLT